MMRDIAEAAGNADHAIAKNADIRYDHVMTKLLEQAVAATDKLFPELQGELARMILAFAAKEQEVYELSEEELASLETALAEADRGEFATDEEVAALWTNTISNASLHPNRPIRYRKNS